MYFGDEIEIVDADGVILNGSVVALLSDTRVSVTCGTLSELKEYYVRRKIKTNLGASADIQNSYSDSSENVFVASNSIPHWTINPQKRIRLFDTVNESLGTTINIADHNYYDGDLVTYTVAVGNKLTNFNVGESYYVKRLTPNSIALAYTPENIRSG